MRHNMQIRIARKPEHGSVFTCKNVAVREKLLRFLFGDSLRLTILVPGDSVDEVDIREKGEEATHEAV